MSAPVLRVLRGRPGDADLAALAAVLILARPGGESGPPAARAASWLRSGAGYLAPGAWTAGSPTTLEGDRR
ncbi:acyl-CoA carboxylase epsilon subunit [Nonomuraea sp. NPDC050310]|uniref:acyl-CoA carboxylase epsilon subunit n=1 Tax=unclassified Nonomuraea TaxID=2593643 RepID=UPI0033F7BEE7